MSGPLGERIPPKPKQLGPEWAKTATPGVWKHLDTGCIETWFDVSGKPIPGEPPSKRPIAEDDSTFIICVGGAMVNGRRFQQGAPGIEPDPATTRLATSTGHEIRAAAPVQRQF